MLTTREMLDLLYQRGRKVTYEQLMVALDKLRIRLRRRVVHGMPIWAYLDKGAIHRVAEYFWVDLYREKSSQVEVAGGTEHVVDQG